MDEYISKEAVFQVVHGIARGITTKDTEALKTKDMKTLYKIKGAKEILDSVDTDLCYIPVADVQPVKHGQWRKAEQGYDTYVECSECGLNLEMSNYVESEWRELLKYCPCCGARMDLKDGDIE